MASSKKAVYAAIAGNFSIAVTKFAGAAISGSSAMLTEGIHSLVDTGNGGLLLLGMRRAKRPPDEQHPFGYGKSLYFYTLIVAILIFGVGGGVSIYEGIKHALHPGAIESQTISLLGLSFTGLTLNIAVLVVAILFESWAGYTALVEFNKERGQQSMWKAIRTSKDPTTFTVLFEDSAALAGLVVALVGVVLAHQLQMPVIDGIASIGIGLILCGVASFLVWESKGLLLGESADPEERAAIQRLARADEGVEEVGRTMTMHLGPHEVLLTLELKFADDLSAEGVEAAVDRVERAIRAELPHVKRIFVEAESLAATRRSGGQGSAQRGSGRQRGNGGDDSSAEAAST
ncbi:MAG: transporter [Bacteroidetes bacterium QS_9_68_14]|nr:MAG: transporter [Bacteroidetes bacterium QS_9_68_14]